MGVLQNGWFIMENPIEMNYLGGNPILGHLHIATFWQPQNRCRTVGGLEIGKYYWHPENTCRSFWGITTWYNLVS